MQSCDHPLSLSLSLCTAVGDYIDRRKSLTCGGTLNHRAPRYILSARVSSQRNYLNVLDCAFIQLAAENRYTKRKSAHSDTACKRRAQPIAPKHTTQPGKRHTLLHSLPPRLPTLTWTADKDKDKCKAMLACLRLRVRCTLVTATCPC